jgi:hypothetical protein
MVKLDIGCGTRKKDGFVGVDRIPFPGVVDVVHDLTVTPWPWEDSSVAEAHCSHFLEHLTAPQRVAFANELFRVLVPGGQCQIITPHWASNRAYGDPTHCWPPVAEMWFMYLNRDWRKDQAPHTDIANWPEGFNCHFGATWGYNMRPDLIVRNQEFQQFAMANYKEVVTDMIATITKA